MSCLVALTICLIAFITRTHSHNVFLRPPTTLDESDWSDVPVYNVGDSIDIQWVSDFEYQDLILWQEYPQLSKDEWHNETLLEDSRSTSKIYTVSFDQFDNNVSKGQWAVFKLTLYNTSSDTYDASSYFNVSVAGKTYSSATATAATATVTVFESDTNSEPSRGAIAGISVAATLASLALLAGIGFLAFRHMRKANNAGYIETQQVPPLDDHKPELSPLSPTELQGARPELSSGQPINSPNGHPYSQGSGRLYEAP